jgi:hypothetical protein
MLSRRDHTPRTLRPSDTTAQRTLSVGSAIFFRFADKCLEIFRMGTKDRSSKSRGHSVVEKLWLLCVLLKATAARHASALSSSGQRQSAIGRCIVAIAPHWTISPGGGAGGDDPGDLQSATSVVVAQLDCSHTRGHWREAAVLAFHPCRSRGEPASAARSSALKPATSATSVARLLLQPYGWL